jgi:hypothetical protein
MHALALVFVILGAQTADYLAVVPDRFSEEMKPLLMWRASKGRSVQILSPEKLAQIKGAPVAADDLRLEILRTYTEGGKALKYVLLVGDAGEGGVPAFLVDHYRWMNTDQPRMATDAPYADLEGDFEPELAVGRLSVAMPEQLKKLVDKILRFEKAALDPERRLKILLFGGASGYSPAVDRFIEAFSRRMLDNFLPQQYDLDVIFANLPSPYCPPPDELGRFFAEGINREPAYTVFMGHGSKTSCFGMNWDRGRMRLGCGFTLEQIEGIREDGACGPLFCFSCDNGFFDADEPCLAEAFLRHPGGPVCVVASSRYSHPLPNLYSAQALLESIDGSATAGELLNRMKIRGHKKGNPLTDMLLKDAEGSLEEEINVARLKEDQFGLFNLFGDPATRIAPPTRLKVTASLNEDASGVEVRAPSPFPRADGYVAFCRLRTWEPKKTPLPDLKTAEKEWRAAKTALFEEVNDKEFFRLPLEGVTSAEERIASIELKEVPAEAREAGKFRIIVYLSTPEADAAGATLLEMPR